MFNWMKKKQEKRQAKKEQQEKEQRLNKRGARQFNQQGLSEALDTMQEMEDKRQNRLDQMSNIVPGLGFNEDDKPKKKRDRDFGDL